VEQLRHQHPSARVHPKSRLDPERGHPGRHPRQADRHLTEQGKRILRAGMETVNQALDERRAASSDVIAVAQEHGVTDNLSELPEFIGRRYARRLTDACARLEEMGDPNAWEASKAVARWDGT